MRSKLYAVLTGLLCFCVVVACEIPQSVTVKGSPGIFLKLDMGKKLDEQLGPVYEYLDPSYITRLIETDGVEVKNYDYAQIAVGPDTDEIIDGTEVQTFRIRFPIARQPLDLTTYMEQDIKIPSIRIPDLQNLVSPIYLSSTGVSLTHGTPLFTIPLGSMPNWVSEVVVAEGSGVKLKGAGSLQTALKLYIPALGIGTSDSYLSGRVTDDGDLEFTGSAPDARLLDPGDFDNTSTIKVYAQIVSAVSKTDIDESPVVFKWISAKVSPGNDTGGFKGDAIIPVHDLIDALGGAKFYKIPAYLFLGGLPGEKENYNLILKAGTADLNPTNELANTGVYDPEINEITGYTAFFNLEEQFSSGSDIKIEYAIQAPGGVEINPEDSTYTITADLVVVLPLQFTGSGTPEEIMDQNGILGSYIKLNLDALENFGSDDEDLFQRDGSDDVIDQVKSVNLVISELKNTVFEGLILGITANPGKNHQKISLLTLDEGNDGYKSLNFDNVVTARPFKLDFAAYIKSDKKLTLKPNPVNGNEKIDFKIEVTAEADIKIKMDL